MPTTPPPPEVASLAPFFHPRAIAVVGASRKRGTVGGDLFHNLVARDLDIPVYPVNARAPAVQSIRAYPTVSAIPDKVDLVVISVPAKDVLAVVDDCARAGARALVVLSAGFRETGAEGRVREDELVARVRRHGMRMIGPNCLGLLSTDPACEVDATFAPDFPPAGNVAFGSQSGALGLAVLETARQLGIGISQFVSLGNKADVSGNDLLEVWEADPRTRVILLYLESFGNPSRFAAIARRVSRTKPIVVVKAGRTAAGARAASSHTGALAGADVAVDALLAHAGVIRTDTMEQLFDVARLLSNQPAPRGNRVAILTNGGGPGIMAADACEPAGLKVPELSPATVLALRGFLPPEASVRNPVDMIATAGAASYERALSLLLADDNVDAVLVLFVHPFVTNAVDVADAVARASREAIKPVLTCFMGQQDVPQAQQTLSSRGVPCYPFPETAVQTLGRVASSNQRVSQAPIPPRRLAVDADRVGRLLAMLDTGPSQSEGRWIPPDMTRELLLAYGFTLPGSAAARSEEEAVAAATRLGFPVAIKLVSPTITHKTDVGGVILDVTDGKGVKAAYRAIHDRLASTGRGGEMAGVQVQQMVPAGLELALGTTAAAGVGRLVAFGLGGVDVELHRDVVFALAPLDERDAAQLIERIHGVRALDGWRGRPAVNRPALIETLLRLSQLATDLPRIIEMDLNPVVSTADGRLMVVDARIKISSP